MNVKMYHNLVVASNPKIISSMIEKAIVYIEYKDILNRNFILVEDLDVSMESFSRIIEFIDKEYESLPNYIYIICCFLDYVRQNVSIYALDVKAIIITNKGYNQILICREGNSHLLEKDNILFFDVNFFHSHLSVDYNLLKERNSKKCCIL